MQKGIKVKHYKSCTKQEKQILHNRLKQIGKVSNISKHVFDNDERFRKFTNEDLKNVVPYVNDMLTHSENIKEISLKPDGKVRVLMKSKFVLKGTEGKEFYLCYSVSLDCGNLVTVIPVGTEFPNYKEAKHKPYYEEDFDLVEYVK